MSEEAGKIEASSKVVVDVQAGACGDAETQSNAEAAHPGGAILGDVPGLHDGGTGRVEVDEARTGEVFEHTRTDEAHQGTDSTNEQGGDTKDAFTLTTERGWNYGRLAIFIKYQSQ